MDPVVEAIKVMADMSIEGDRALLKLLEALIEKVDKLEERIKELEFNSYQRD